MVAVADDVDLVTVPSSAYPDGVPTGAYFAALHGSVGDPHRRRQRSSSGSGLVRCGECLGRGALVRQGTMPAVGVVVRPELIEQIVELGERGRGVPGSEPALQGLPEPFDLAAGLRLSG